MKPRGKKFKRLSEQQKKRIRARRMVTRAKRRLRHTEAVESALLGEEIEGQVITLFGLDVEVEDGEGRRFLCALRNTLEENTVCGDRVLFQPTADQRGVITSILPRKTFLSRPGYQKLQRILAANLDQLLITVTGLDPNPGLVDRYLVAALAAKMDAVVVINKMDQPHDPEVLAELEALYQSLNTPFYMVSAETGQGIADLKAVLKSRVSAFVGPSGVGKTSLAMHFISEAIRADDEAYLKTRQTHEATDQGRHTTTISRLYHLSCGGDLIDSPGVRSFTPEPMLRQEVIHYFPDIVPFINQCRFSDCSHLHEPGCAVQAAVDRGDIHPRRLMSLWRIIESMPESYPGNRSKMTLRKPG
ncbi:ribosome small subunit-dependent GTPase A [Magnetococcales bacterium HHB-1]